MTKKNSQSKIARLCLALLCLPVAGCGTYGRIDLKDNNAPAYIGSVAIRPEQWQRRSGRAGGALEFVYERFRGDDVSNISNEARLARVVITAPQTVDIAADIDIARLAYSHRLRFGPYMEIEPSLGLSYIRRDIDVQTRGTPAQLILSHQSSFGLGGAIAARFKFNRTFGIEARGSAAVSGPTGHSQTAHIALLIVPLPNTVVRLGYYDHDTDDEGKTTRDGAPLESMLYLRMSGPLLSIGYEF